MDKVHKKLALWLFSLVVAFLISIRLLPGVARPITYAARGEFDQQPEQTAPAYNASFAPNSTALTPTLQTSYLPLTWANFSLWGNPFGVESSDEWLFPGSLIMTRAADSYTSYARLNDRISWRQLQPVEGGPINWSLLTYFEQELYALRGAGITPIVVVDDYPHWAVDPTARDDGQLTSCGRLLPDKVDDFAVFVQSLVARYKAPEFNVHIWEMGNEPDVDPNIVPPDNMFGCWGEIEDPNYGGERYGQMIIAVSTAIHAEDPTAQVWIGGLLLDRPFTSDPTRGRPELFLQGILEAGAAPYIDMVPYHSYPPYQNQRIDHDNAIGGPWDAWGGGYLGKARFLRSLMAPYGVNIPVFITETALMCYDGHPWCNPPSSEFFQMQATFLVRAYVRGLSEDIGGYIWFTLDGPGWRNTGLLDENFNPRPAYYAYQQLAFRLTATSYNSPYTYGDGIEAYSFAVGPNYLHVAWAITDTTYSIAIPHNSLIAAYTRDGQRITPTPSGPYDYLTVQFEPIYILRSTQ